MTRTEAFHLSLTTNVKITHRYFDSKEYLNVIPNNKIRYEDGVECTIIQFYEDRKHNNSWNSDWEVFRDI